MNASLWIALISAVVVGSAKTDAKCSGKKSDTKLAPERDGREFPMNKFSTYSVHHLEELMELDWRIFSAVRDYIFGIAFSQARKVEEKKPYRPHPTIGHYLQELSYPPYAPFWSHQNTSAISAGKEAMNPLAIFRTMWRFEHYLRNWWEEGIPGFSEGPGIQKIVRDAWDPRDGPKTEDLTAATISLLRLQRVYSFTATELSDGLLAGTNTGLPFDANMSTALSHRATYMDLADLAVEWAEVAVRKVKQRLKRETEADIAEDLRTAERELDVAKRILEVHRKYESEAPGVMMSQANSPMVVDKDYQQLCAGKIEQSAVEKCKLFCWLETEIHPSWKIGPLKAEFLSLGPEKPEVVQYHDVLPAQLMSTNSWSQDSLGKHSKCSVIDWKVGVKVVDPMAKLCAERLLDPEGPEGGLVTELRGLVNRMTGVRMSRYKVAAYAAGGHYYSHLDSDDDTVSDHASQLATFIGYLNDVETGGETVFPLINIRVTPKKGSAIFWYNTLSSGRLDMQTLHASCPVLFGQKHILTSWALYRLQSHISCYRDPDRRVETLVNGRSKYPRA